MVPNHVRYQTALHLEISFYVYLLNLKWQGWRDSNPRRTVLETDALPTELHPYIFLVDHQGLEPRTYRL